MKYYRNSANPPENIEMKDFQERDAANPSLSLSVPDVLVRSIQNPAYLYEEIDAMKPPETKPIDQNQWRPPFNEMLNQYDNEVHNTEIINPEGNAAPSPYPGRTIRSSSSPPPPVPDTRRPPTSVTPRIRSQTDVNPTPPLPLKRKFSDAPDTHFNPSFNLDQRMPRKEGTARNSSQRRPSDGLGRHIPPNPPPLVPRATRPSEGNPRETISEVPRPDGISGEQKAIYSNVPPPISEAGEGPNGDNGDNDGMDDDGYIQCVRSYPQNDQHKSDVQS